MPREVFSPDRSLKAGHPVRRSLSTSYVDGSYWQALFGVWNDLHAFFSEVTAAGDRTGI